MIVALILTSSGLLYNSRRSLANSDLRLDIPQPARTVEVTFDGLMVFAKVADHYEVGILEPHTAQDHEFKITVGKDELDHSRISGLLNLGNMWSLDIVGGSGRKPALARLRQAKPCNRVRDTQGSDAVEAHVTDFCWMMDLEKEFHGSRPLLLRPNLLKPIISLNGGGELYAKTKSDELDRERRPGVWANYGFVTETTGLRINLTKGERLVLSVAGHEVFSLPTEGGITSAGIFNAPKKDYHHTKRNGEDHSHFLYYYDLFSNVTDNERLDIRATPNGRRPKNPVFPDKKDHELQKKDATLRADDRIRIRTTDDYACGGAFLGVRKTSLSAAP